MTRNPLTKPQRRALRKFLSGIRPKQNAPQAQPSKIWLFLNSSFFLWLGGSVLLATFANFYARVQICQTEVLSARDQFVLASEEERARLRQFVYRAAKAKDITELKKLIDEGRDSTQYFYSKYRDAKIKQVGLDLARSLQKLEKFQDMAQYLDFLVGSGELRVAKALLYGADISDGQLDAYQRGFKNMVQAEQATMHNYPFRIFDIDYPPQLGAVEDVPVCTWTEIAKDMIIPGREDHD
jgi:hypothetical protein